jgi:3-hydroxybutyryl-CoA dehydratase
MRFEELSVGMSAERARMVTADDVLRYAEVTGDFNPVHVDRETAEKSRFGGLIAHGMLSAGYVSAVLGMDLPGPGAIYLAQSLKFTCPVKPGDTITARVEVLEVIAARRRVRLATTCRNQHGEPVLEGEATVLVPEDSG